MFRLSRQRSRRTAVVTAAVLCALAPAAAARATDGASPGGAPAINAPGGAAARADVNGDGIADMVVSTGARLTYAGDPNTLGVDRGGSIEVIPGGGTLPAAPAVVISQDSHSFVPGSGEDDDRFGQTLVTGDFNGDGLADVAVGNPTEAFGTTQNVGMVTVLYGMHDAPYLGLIPNTLTQIDQNQAGVPGDNEAGDMFGASLTGGDFNADGYADLAIGVPGESVGSTQRAGTVTVVFGGVHGLTGTHVVGIDEDTTGVNGVVETDDRFGWSLAAGDVTGDARDDLVIGASGEAVSGTTGAWGGVWLVPGAATGMNTAATTDINVANAGTQDHWRSVAVGRFHGGSNADVLVSADRKKGAPQYAGALVVARGGSDGINANRVQTLDQSSPGIADTPEENDFFAGSLAVGDLDGDGYDDLAAGSLREDNLGTVTLLRGGTAGLLSAAGTTFNENTPAIGASAQVGEGFGYGLRILDVTGDGTPELLVTAPWEDGSLQSGALFRLSVGVSGGSLTVTGSSSATRGALGGQSNFGPATPFAGGAVVTLDTNQQPQRRTG